jgi:hypothetical protein
MFLVDVTKTQSKVGVETVYYVTMKMLQLEEELAILFVEHLVQIMDQLLQVEQETVL